MIGANYAQMERAIIDATQQGVLCWECNLTGFSAVHSNGLDELVLKITRDGGFRIEMRRGATILELLTAPDILSAVLRCHRGRTPITNHAVELLVHDLERRVLEIP